MLLLTDSSLNSYELDASSPLTRILKAIAPQYGNDVGAAVGALSLFVQGNALSAGDPLAVAIGNAATNIPEIKALLDSAFGEFLIEKNAGSPPHLVARKLADVAAPLSYQIAKSANPKPLELGDATLTFGGQAQGTASISVLKPDADDSVKQLTLPAGDVLVQFELNGNVDVNGAYKIPFNAGTASVSASAGAGVKLDARFQWPASSTAAGALVFAVDNLVSPWNLEEVAARLAYVDIHGAFRGLRQIVQQATGTMAFAGALSVGRSWAYNKQGFAGSNELNAKLGASLSLDVTWSRKGTFDFAVSRDTDGALVVEVSKHQTTDDSLTFDFSADLAVTGLAAVVQPIVDRLLPDDAGLMTDLRKWSAPGTELADRLSKALDAKNPFWGEFAGYLLGTTSSDAFLDQLKTLLGKAIQRSADRLVPFWSKLADPNGLVQQVTANALADLGLESAASEPLIQSLLAPALQALTGLIADLKGQLATYANLAEGDLIAKLAPLTVVGEDVRALVANIKSGVNQSATALFDPVIQLLTRYEQVRKQIDDAVMQANDLKVGAALKIARSREVDQQSDLVVRFRPNNKTFGPRATLIYRALMLGRLDTVGTLWAEAIANKEIDEPTGNYATTITRNRSLDLSVYFGDHTIDWSQIGTSVAQINVAPNGMVVVGSQSRFSYQALSKAGGATDAANFGGTIDVASALANPTSTLPLTFAFGLTYTDKRMSKKDLSAYLQTLIQGSPQIALLRADSVTRALDLLGKTVGDARLAVGLTLDATQVDSLVRASAGEVLKIARAALIGARATSELETSGVLLRIAALNTPVSAADTVEEIALHHPMDPEWLSKTYRDKTGDDLPTTGFTSAGQRIQRDILSLDNHAKGLLSALSALAQTRQRLADAGIAAGDSYSALSEKYAKALDAINAQVMSGLSYWFMPAPWIDLAPPGVVALLSTMAQLAGAPAPVLSPILQINGQSGRTIAF